MANVRQIFNYISSLNPTVNHISSLGSYVSDTQQSIADSCRVEVMAALPADSLGRKIIEGNNGRYSDKQLWAIAYSLERNEEFGAKVAEFFEEIERKASFKKARKAAKAKGTMGTFGAKKKVEVACPAVVEFVVGDKAQHRNFGAVTVTAIDEKVITVELENGSHKMLARAFATLTK